MSTHHLVVTSKQVVTFFQDEITLYGEPFPFNKQDATFVAKRSTITENVTGSFA